MPPTMHNIAKVRHPKASERSWLVVVIPALDQAEYTPELMVKPLKLSPGPLNGSESKDDPEYTI